MERALLGMVLWLALSCGVAHAGNIALLLNGHAVHLRYAEGYDNESNYGFGLQYDLEHIGPGVPFAFGTGFQDSHRDPSYALGGGYRRRVFEVAQLVDIDLGFTAMLMTRRTYEDSRPFPAVLPMASVGVGRVALNALYIPDVDPRFVPLLFFQLRYELE